MNPHLPFNAGPIADMILLAVAADRDPDRFGNENAHAKRRVELILAQAAVVADYLEERADPAAAAFREYATSDGLLRIRSILNILGVYRCHLEHRSNKVCELCRDCYYTHAQPLFVNTEDLHVSLERVGQQIDETLERAEYERLKAKYEGK